MYLQVKEEHVRYEEHCCCYHDHIGIQIKVKLKLEWYNVSKEKEEAHLFVVWHCILFELKVYDWPEDLLVIDVFLFSIFDELIDHLSYFQVRQINLDFLIIFTSTQ